MRGIVLYKSKYGATKKYAEWIAEETGYDIMDITKVNKKDLVNYDVFVLGGGIYAMGISCLGFLRKNFEQIKDKKIYVYCDGASPFSEEAFEAVKNRNMTDELSNIPLFYFRGGWDMEHMSFVDRNLCKMLQKAVGKKNPADYEIWEKALMEAGDEKCDWTNKAYIQPLLQELV